MKPRLFPLTRDLLRKHFGKDARISARWLASGYRVKTRAGGEVLVSRRKFEIVSGGDEIYRGVTLLSKDLWGSMTAYGNPEQLLALKAQGEACNVDVRVGGKNAWLFHDRKRMADAVAFNFPRVNGDAHFSTDEDLENGGLL
jgi:hypothetical protein